MKKVSILAAAVLLFSAAIAVSDEATLIDFTLLDTDDGKTRTVMDFSTAAPISATEDQKALYKSSLELVNWEVVLNSSATNPISTKSSGTKGVQVKDLPVVPEYFRGKTVLGVRAFFPPIAANAEARIVPPFEIPAFDPLEGAAAREDSSVPTKFEDGYGVLKNVGAIKEISVRVRGNLFPHFLYVLLEDEYGVERRYPIGALNFEGWKTLTWKNPAYIADVRKRALVEQPLYPNTDIPFIKFAGFLVERVAMNGGGDFISYFGDVRVIYDKALIVKETDIDEDAAWEILKQKEDDRLKAEMEGFGSKQIRQINEREKIAPLDQTFENLDNPNQAQP